MVSVTKRPPEHWKMVHENRREQLATTRLCSVWVTSIISVLLVMTHATGLELRRQTVLQIKALGPFGLTNLYRMVVSVGWVYYTINTSP